ncbi:ABC transporter substrate-binding protein [Neptuniibacter sp.]|uniref:substrate-binding periplasmic protein n=1 Tax=Neptuniibacter sp. TaxID=1962643 RepID=UPI00262920C1|nr:transporter substrate-binding domain-containing protein [Neptuniibacter sp.]MCP4595495.1 transporter substrate-binding domain-containing protein [Neptuniibacter sp.]
MLSIRHLFSVLILLFAFAKSATADKITIAADVWCPFNCDPSADQPGFMIEVANKVFSARGYEVNYIVMSWSRAIREAELGNINGIIGAFPGDAPHFIFPEQELSILSNTFFIHKDSNWRYQGVDSLKQIQLVAISGYDYGPELRDYIQQSGSEHVSLLSGQGQPLRRGIKMLNLKRVGAIVEADQVFWYTAQQLGVAENFKAAGRSSEPMKSYIAFSPALENSSEFAQILSEGIVTLRASGELAEILQKYGLKDWR